MARYKYAKYLKKSDSDAYDEEHKPGETCPNSGIWRCISCGDEIAANKGDPLPPQNHRQHDPEKGKIRWRLIVFAEQL